MRSGRHGAKPADLSSLREVFDEKKTWNAIGVVRARSGDGSHYKKDSDDILVDVDLSPEGQQVWCRLSAVAGGSSRGVWRIPPADTEVAVLVPDGHVQSSPMIVGTLSTGGIDSDIDGDLLLVVNDKAIKIKSTDEDITIDAGKGVTIKANGGDVEITATGVVKVNGDQWPMLRSTQLLNDLAAALGVILASNSGGPILNAAQVGTSWTPFLLALQLPAETNPYLSSKAENG